MAQILEGRPVADALDEITAQKVEHLKAYGIQPTLAIARVGARKDDLSYERGALKKCEKLGIAVHCETLSDFDSNDIFLPRLKALNADANIHGILLLRPLPRHLDEEYARLILPPQKDVDGCTDGSLCGVFTNRKTGFAPCTAQAAMEMLHYYDIPISGKRAVVIGRSLVVGRPVAMMLMHENATVTICHTKTQDTPSLARQADILICASGQMESVDRTYMNHHQTVLDVGIGWNEQKQKLCGDVCFEHAEEVAQAVSPVPGGVGSVTTSVLARHVAEAAERCISRKGDVT